jgi:hypothetical protein
MCLERNPESFCPASISATLPALMVLVGILLNKSDINRLDTQMSKLNDKMDAVRDSFHSDILMLVQRDGDKYARISRLEECGRQG